MSRSVWLVLAILSVGFERVYAYDPSAAVSYINEWYQTDLDGDHNVDHINNSSPKTVHGGTKQYLFQYDKDGKTNIGDNTISMDRGEDCTNFVSQALIEGQIQPACSADIHKCQLGSGGTFVAVRNLESFLRKIVTPYPFTSAAGAPADLSPGDVVEWDHGHMTMVVRGSGRNAIVGAHTNFFFSPQAFDSNNMSLGMKFKGHSIAYAYRFAHASDRGSLDTTPPTMVVQTPAGTTIPDGGIVGTNISVTVKGSGVGPNPLEITRGDTIYDSEANIGNGRAAYVFADPTACSGNGNVCNVDLTSLPNGTSIFVQAFDEAGDVTMQKFVKDDSAPSITGFVDSGAVPIYGLIAARSATILAHSDIGLDRILVETTVDPQTYTLNGASSATIPLSGLGDDDYYIEAIDVAGNPAFFSFRNQPEPRLDVRVGRISVTGFHGTSSQVQSTVYPATATISASDVAGIVSVKVTDSKGGTVFSDQPSVPVSSYTVSTAALSNLGPGLYTVEVDNAVQGSTIFSFRIVSLTVQLDYTDSTSKYDPVTDSFDAALAISVNSDLPIDSVIQVDPQSGDVVQQLSGQGMTSSTMTFSGFQVKTSSVGWDVTTGAFIARDSDGNQVAVTVRLVVNSAGTLCGDFVCPSGAAVNFRESLSTTPLGDFEGTYLIDSQINPSSQTAQGVGGNGTFKSPIFDLTTIFGGPFLPGAVMDLGLPPPPGSTPAYLPSGFGVTIANAGYIAAPWGEFPGDRQDIGNVGMSVEQGNSPTSLASTLLYQAEYYETVNSPGTEFDVSQLASEYQPLSRYFRYDVALQKAASPGTVLSCKQSSPTDPTYCTQGLDFMPSSTFVGPAIKGVTTYFDFSSSTVLDDVISWAVPSGAPQTLNLGDGVTLTNITLKSPVNLSASVDVGGQPPLAFQGYDQVARYSIEAQTVASPITEQGTPLGGVFGGPQSGVSVAAPFTISLAFDGAQMTPAQAAAALVVQLDVMTGSATVIPATITSQGATFTSSSVGEFLVIAPAFESPASSQSGPMSFLANQAVTVTPADTSSPDVASALAMLASEGLAPVSSVYRLGPSGTTFNPPGVVSFRIPQALLQAGGQSAPPQLYQFSTSGAGELLGSQAVDWTNGVVSARVGQFHSLFAIFQAAAPVPLPDSTPPITQVSLLGPEAVDPGTGLPTMPTSTLVSLTASDPSVSNHATSGVANTYFLIDQLGVFGSTQGATSYVSPFSLATGTHTVSFFSVDSAGNFEIPQSTAVFVVLPDTAPPVTTLSISGPTRTNPDGSVTLNAFSGLVLTATDTVISGSFTSGVAGTRYLLDQAFISTATTPGEPYSAPIQVAGGTHTFTWFSFDLAGNIETPKALSLDASTSTIQIQAPTGLEVSAVSDTAISFTWSANGNSSGASYSVFATTIGSVNDCSAAVPSGAGQTVSTTSALVVGLTPTTSYGLVVCVAPSGPCSNPVTIATLASGATTQVNPVFNACSGGTTSSSPPGPASLLGVADTFADLAWSPGANAPGVSYAVLIGTAPNTNSCSEATLSPVLMASTASARVSGLSPSTPYVAQVCTGPNACDQAITFLTASAGSSEQSNPSFAACSSSSAGIGGPLRGLALGADSAGKLWEVVEAGGAIELARFTGLARDFSVALPNASDADGAWTVKFDHAGAAYAVGTAQPPGTAFEDVAVYKVSPAGILLSSSAFHAGDTSQAVAWDANGDLWITGYIQTSTASISLTMGLWHYSMATGLLGLTTAYTRGGPADAGFGVRALDNAVYVEGYSSTQPLSTPSLDLALWKFDSQGHGPIAGPFLDEAYLTNLSNGVAAKIEVTSGTLYAAAQRSNPAGYDDLGFLRYDANGNVLSEHYATVGGGISLMPAAMAIDGQGNIAVAITAGGAVAGHGIARFAPDGGLVGIAADSQSTAAVYGMATLGNDIWLAVDGSSVPVLFKGDQAIPATDVMVSSGPVDSGPPVTSLLASGFGQVTSTATLAAGTTFTLSAVDPPDPSGLSSGVAETLYWVDVDPFACNADFDPAQPAGSCANPVYGGPFQLAGGTHTIAFQSTDAAGNFDEMNVTSVTIMTPASVVSDLAASAASSSALDLRWSSPADVPSGAFLIAVSTQPSDLSLASAQVTISTANARVGDAESFRLSGLAAGTTYYLAVWTRTDVGASAASNVAAAQTPYLALSQDGTASLISFAGAETVATVSTATQSSAMTAAASQGLALAGGMYDVSPSGIPFNPRASLTIAFNPVGISTAALGIYTFDGVSWSSSSIASQAVSVFSSTSAQVGGLLAHASLYALFVPAAPTSSTPTATAQWSAVRHDQARTGLSTALAPTIPVKKWTFNVAGAMLGEPSLAADGTLYIADRDGPGYANFNLVAIDPTGALKWRALTGGGHMGSVVRGDGVIFVGGTRLWALRPDGSAIWSLDSGCGTACAVFSTPLIAPDGSLWATRDDNNTLIKVDPNTGAVTQQVTLPLRDNLPPALGSDGTIYVGGTNDGKVYAVRPDGSIAWSFTTPVAGNSDGLTPRTPLVHPSGKIIVAAGHVVQALNPDGTLAWTFDSGRTTFQGMPVQFSYALAVGPDGTIYGNDDSFVYAIDPANGALKWSFNNGGADTFNSGNKVSLAADGSGAILITSVASSTGQYHLLAINANGTLRWSQSAPGVTTLDTPAIDPSGNVYVGDENGDVFQIGSPDPATLVGSTPWTSARHDQARTGLAVSSGPVVPTAQWTFTVAGAMIGEPSLAADGTLYVADRDGPGFANFNLLAINPDGTLKWRALTGGGHDGSVARADGTVYVGGTRLWALKPDGTPLWSIDSGKGTAEAIFSTPLIGPDGFVWSSRADLGAAAKVDPKTGAIAQSVSLPISIPVPPAMAADGTMYFGGTSDGKLYALNQDGSTKWTFATAGTADGTSPGTALVTAGGRIVIANSHYIQAVNADGSLAWTYNSGRAGIQFSYALAMGPDGTIVANDDSNVYALNPANGALKWKFNDGAHVFRNGFGSAPTVDSNGTVYITALVPSSSQNSLLAINSSGALAWAMPAQGLATLNSPILDGAGSVYFGDGNGDLYKLIGEFLAASTTTIRGAPTVQVASLVSGVSVVPVSTTSAGVSLALATASVQGLQLVSGVFQVDPSTAFSPAAQITFRFDPSVVLDTTSLALYRFDGVSWSSAGLIISQLVSLGADPLVSATLAHSSWYALFVKPSDVLPPRTTLAAGLPRYGTSPLFISSATALSLSAVDDKTTVGDGLGSGVARTLVAVDSAPFAAYTGPFTLVSEGTHTLRFYSVDLAGNTEVVRSAILAVDLTAPVTASSVGAPSFQPVGGPLAVSPATPVTFSAADPGGASASGVNRVEIAVDGGAFSVYAGTLTFSEGLHTVLYRSVDNVGNTEPTRTLALQSDATPPITALVPSATFYTTGGQNYAAADLSYGFTAVDTVSSGAASGVASTSFAIDSSSFQAFASTFSLNEGLRMVSFHSADNVGNVELLKSATIYVDGTAPASAFSFGAPYFKAADGTNYVTPATPLTFSAADPALPTGQPGSGVARVEVSVDSAPFAASTAPLAFGEGRHLVLYRAVDNVGNVEAAKTLSLESDATPPLTMLAVAGGRQFPAAGGASFYASTDTRLALTAADPVVNGVASGLALTRWQDNGASTQPYTAPLALSEGSHLLSYQSQDNAGNLEVLRSTTALVDGTPPLTQLALIGGRQFPGPDGSTFYASSDTRFTLSAVDPMVGGVASGLALTRWQDNSGPLQALAGSFALAEGAHALGYQSEDNVGNLEVLRSTNAWIDATPPVSAAAFGTPYYRAADGTSYVTPSTPLTLTAADPALPTGQPGSGVARLEVSLDGAPFVAYATALTFPEGRHTVSYRAVDNVGNVEAAHELFVQSDATPPATSVATAGGRQFPGSDGSSFYASADTRLLLQAADPIVGGVASGLAFTRWEDNGGSTQAYSAPLTLAEGVHHLAYQSQDNVGNLEVLRSTTALIDATAPLTQLVVQGGRQYPGPDSQTIYASPDSRISLPAADPVANGVASGLALTRWQDNGGALQTYVLAFGLAEGAHALGYQSQDNVGNLEVLRSTNVWIDATAPVSALAFGAPHYHAPDGTDFITPATPLTLTAADPGLPTGQPGSGVARIEVSLDGAPFAAFAGALTLAEGRHTVSYRAVDNVGNVEAAHTVSLQSDATPPLTTLALSGGRQFPGPDGSSFFASAGTLYAFPASDPAGAGVVSGLAFTRWQDNGGSTQTFSAPFALAEGVHHLAYQSQDNVGNLEVLRSTTALVDATAPLTQLAVLGGRQYPGPDAATFYASSDTRFALPAADPVSNGVASGLASTSWQDSGGAFQAYAAPFTLSEGAHALGYQSQDNVGNLEVLRSTGVRVDATPPVSSFAFGTPYYQAPDGTNYVTPATPLTFTAADPALPGGLPGSGLARIEVSVDGAPFTAFVSSLTFAEGPHTVLYRAVDNVGNVEAARTLALRSDATPPVTALAAEGGHQHATADGSGFYASADTRYALSAADPAVNGVASGVALTRWQDNGGAFQNYASPFALAEGVHHLGFQSQDQVQNLEVLRSTSVLVDATPPVTALAVVGGRQFPGPDAQTFYASPDVRLALVAADPTVNGIASGLAFTSWQDGAGAWQTYSSTVALAEGAHAFSYRSQDNVANLEVAHSTNVWVDATPPASTFAFGAPYFKAADGTNYVTPATPITFAATDPALPSGQPGSGVSRVEVSIDAAPFAPYTAALTLAEGRHAILYRAVDNVGNVEASHTLAVQSDATPPATALSSSGGHQFPGPDSASFFASADTRFAFQAADPVSNGVASGLAFTRWQDNGGSTQTFTAPFALAEGAHHLAYESQDNVGNLEVGKSTTALIDATAPLTQLALMGGRQFPGPDAQTIYASSATRVALSAVDPAVAGVASGLALTRWQDNGGAFQSFTAGFGLSEGAHALGYQSQDNVANVEVLRSTNIWVDATPPATTFAIGKPYYLAADGTNYVTPATPVTFAATDAALPAGQPGSGVNHIEVAIDGGAYATYATPLTFAEGRHTVLYRSVDNVGNVEAAKTLALQSDATPPLTALAPQGGHQFPGPGASSFFASADTRFAFPATDPVVNGVASGLALTRWADNGGALQAFSAPVALPEGGHHLTYQSQDNVGNLEVLRSTTALIDATAPLTQLALVGGRQFPGPDSGTIYASSGTRLALSAADPLVNGVASGLALTRWQDNGGAFQSFTAAVGLSEGAHSVGYQSQDNVSNLEVLRSTNVWVDATPPVTTFAFGKPYYQAADGTNYVTPATPLSFAAADPALPTGQPGSGVARIEISLDGTTFVPYTAPLTFAEGRHTVLYRSLDNVGNVEATKTLALQSDATPPVTMLALSGGHQFPSSAPASFFASADTRFAFPASDPVVNGVASGVAFTRWGDNGGAPQLFGAPISLAEGVHQLAYQSQDNVGNLEVARSTTALVDATPPLTQLAIVGGRQFAGPDGNTFYASSDTRLALPAADPVSNAVASGLAWTRWQDNNGAFQTFVSSFGLSEGAHKLSYQSADNVANLEVLRSTNVWVDATPPATTFAFGAPYFQAPDGTNYVTPATPLSFAAADPNLPTGLAGSGVNHIEVAVDGGTFAPYAAPLTFAEGRHALLYRAVDNVGNIEAAHALALQADATPPASSLVIGQPQYQLPTVLLVSSRTPFSIPAVDPVVNNVASGVKDTYYRVSDVAPSTAAFAAFATPFTVSGLDVSKVIQFYSRDNVLNTEVVKSSTVLLDATPPEISLLSPAGCDSGICRVLKGKFPVLGTARDLHFASFVLDAAPGQDATAGFTQVSSGSVAISSGTLGVWDASKLSGWQTLRLTATDLVQNTSVLTLNVWVGDPAALMVLGNHDTFNMPTGVAVSSSGAIYVADREADRVEVYSSTGALLASFGGPGHDGDDHGVSTGTLRLHEPAGVAVDGGGDVFVADTDNNRVLKLSPAGQVLLELGRAKAKSDDDHGSVEREEGSGPGEFHEPLGVAVDGAGVIYVADTGNHRVQVFSSSGIFVAQFALPAVPKAHEESSRDEDDDGTGLGKPAAIALDAAGRIYLADPAGHRALVYTSTGALALSVPIVGDRPDQPGTPDGVAVSPSGDCLLVSDKKLDRVLKFDFQGAGNLIFGEKGQGDDKKASSAIVFRKPAGMALDASGNLYVADRNDESIKKFGLPNGQPTLVVPPPGPRDDLEAKDVVDHDAGGTVAREDKAAVAIPPQALPQDLKVTVAPPAPGPDDNSRRLAQQDNQLKVASPPVDFGPEGTKFAVPATLTIPYDPQLVAAQGVSENDLKINYWNPAKQQWEAFDSTVDKANHTVTAKTSHFSLYQVLSSTPGQVGVAGGLTADPTFTVHAVYAFPNPAVRGAKPTIHVAVGVADEVKITILNVAGQEVAHGELYGTPPVIDDGSGPQYAYEWVWDGHIASGMYFYVVEASKAGYPKIRRAGKLGVVR